MIETQGDEQNIRYGFVPESVYQSLMSLDFTIRLDAAQILSKSTLSLSSSNDSDVSKIELTSFFNFAKKFLIDENFGVINCFSEILENLFTCIDKNVLQEDINEAISMLLPPLQDKRNAVRSISSNLVIKYSTALQSTELIEYLISIFYDQPANSQIEILNIVERALSIYEIDLDDDSFKPKLVNLIENAFLIVNANVHAAAVRLLHKINQTKPEIYKIIPEDVKKVAENENQSKITTSRLPRTPTSVLPPIYMSFNSQNMKQKLSQAQQLSSKPPDTAASKKRTDEFWYRSKPRFAKTAGFIIGKGGYVSYSPLSSQSFGSTGNIHQISKNPFVRTPDAVFQPQGSYSPLVTDEQIHIYDQVCESIKEPELKISNNQDIEYNETIENSEEEEGTKEENNEYGIDENQEEGINQTEEEDININNDITNPENIDTDENNSDFHEFDSMPIPRVITENKRKYNKASLINMNEQTDLGDDDKFKSHDNNDSYASPTPNYSPDIIPSKNDKKAHNFEDIPISVKEPHIVFDDSELTVDHFIQPTSPRPRRQFKPRPPSLPPAAPPPLYLSRGGDDEYNCNDNGYDNPTASQPPQGALKIKKLKYNPGGASIRAKHASSSSITAPTARNKSGLQKVASATVKPDLQSIVADLQSTSDWEKQNSALVHITSLINGSPSFISANIRVLVFEIVPLCSSVRSALSKTALECLTSIASSFGAEMNPFFESVVNSILTILLSSRGFITRLASTCISTILHSVARKRALDYLTGDHKKRPGSCKAALAMCIEELVGEGGDEDSSPEVIKAIGSFITDANPEARKYARGAIKKIAASNPNLKSAVSNMKMDESEKKVILDAIGK